MTIETFKMKSSFGHVEQSICNVAGDIKEKFGNISAREARLIELVLQHERDILIATEVGLVIERGFKNISAVLEEIKKDISDIADNLAE